MGAPSTLAFQEQIFVDDSVGWFVAAYGRGFGHWKGRWVRRFHRGGSVGFLLFRSMLFIYLIQRNLFYLGAGA